MAKSDKPYKATDKNKQSVERPEAEDTETVGSDAAAFSSGEKPDSETTNASLADKVADANVTADSIEGAMKEVKQDDAEGPLPDSGQVKDTPPDATDQKADDAAPLSASDPTAVQTDAETSEEKPQNDKTPWGAQAADTVDAEADPVPDLKTDPVMPPPAPQTRIIKASPWPALFGGIVAAMIGFIVGRADVMDQYLPAALQRPTVDISGIEAQTAELASQLEARTNALIARVEALEVAESGSEADAVAALESDLEALTARLTEVENRPAAPAAAPGAPVEAVTELQTALADQNAQIAALAARAEAAEAEAAGEAARLLARAALMRVQTAVDSGDNFDTALADLEAVAPVEIPSALREASETGVPTLSSLQSGFPDAARAGLAAARAEVPEAEVVGITGFIQRQLNVRSVTPREGDDPDAVLSRVQAAVSGGDLTTALTEAEALPEVARNAMNDWLAAATARKSAQDAADTLADSLDSN